MYYSQVTTSSETNTATSNFKTMFKHWSTKHLAVTTIALDEDEQETTKIQKPIWVHDILKRIKT